MQLMTRRGRRRRRTAHLVTGGMLGVVAFVMPIKHVSAKHSSRRCHSLAHVGDSLTYAARDQLAADYRAHGWHDFQISAAGGRGIITFLYEPVTGLQAVQRIKASGFDGCWVMALGTNDTANTDSFAHDPASQHAWRVGLIRGMMQQLDGAPVMWVNTHLIDPNNSYSSLEAEAWNAVLRELQPDYPNMMIFDWDSIAAAHPEWTREDMVHDTPEGSYLRAEFVTNAATQMLRDFRFPWWARVFGR